MRSVVLAALCVALCLLVGCVISPLRNGSGSSGGGGGGTGLGRLYVSDLGNGEILRFDHALSASGSTAPGATFTNINSPGAMFMDTGNDVLYVIGVDSNNGAASVFAFNKPDTHTGSALVQADRGIFSTQLVSPVDLSVDTANDLLYVADSNNGSPTGFIQVFSPASTSGTGSAASTPTRSYSLNFQPVAMFLGSNQQLFVADAQNNVNVFNAINQRTTGPGITTPGTITPDVVLTAGTATLLNKPVGLQVVFNDLIVSNSGDPSIRIYGNANALTQTQAPSGTISGSATLLRNPAHIAVNAATTGGDLYVLDNQAQSILVFTNISSANGSPAPRQITGNPAISTSATGIALDPTR
ncbi:MAG TPA: hypothetical protein VKZ53_15700 [Candidatus Angelobacter sp.]|nr:hypothetical protein [Candidatus Angelobacter sp.]